MMNGASWLQPVRWVVSRVSAVAVAAALVGASGPALAAEADFKGWYIALDAAFTQPNGLEQEYATAAVFGVSSLDSRRLILENDTNLDLRLTAGYSFGKGLGALQVSYWDFDSDDDVSGTETGYVFPSLFSGYYTSSYYLTNPEVEATSSVKATTFDLDYVRPVAVGEKTTLKWLAGLRVASFEEERTFTGDDAGYYDLAQSRSFDSDTYGVRVGAGATFEFTRHFSLEAGVAASLMQGSSQGEAAAQVIDPNGVLLFEETNKGGDDNLRGHILDLEVMAVFPVGPVDLVAGYRASSWEGLVEDPAINAPLSTTDPSRDSVSFNAWLVGLKWRIGGGGP